MWSEVGALTASCEPYRSFVRGEALGALANEVDRSMQCVAVDDDLDGVAASYAADFTAGERLGRDVADARTG
jgi:hypothetical protein